MITLRNTWRREREKVRERHHDPNEHCFPIPDDRPSLHGNVAKMAASTASGRGLGNKVTDR
jgi:hypothetical protein